jgi:hypothetical protein
MQIVFAVLLIFLCIGLFARKFNWWTRLLLLLVIAIMIVYGTFTSS